METALHHSDIDNKEKTSTCINSVPFKASKSRGIVNILLVNRTKPFPRLEVYAVNESGNIKSCSVLTLKLKFIKFLAVGSLYRIMYSKKFNVL